MWTISSILLIVASYLWGSLSPAFVVARWRKGIDLRRYGSGNVGSSNLGEQLGRGWTIVVGALDLLKGFMPAMLARVWGFDWGLIALIGSATVIGHNWSLYLGLTGGRGMATALGSLFAWDMRLAFVLLFILAIGWIVKQTAASSILGLVILTPSAWLMNDAPEIIWASAFVALIIAVKRLEANRLPLPRDPGEKRLVLIRRLVLDRDVPRDQPWEERKSIDT